MKTTDHQESEFDREMRRDPIVKLYQKLSVGSVPSKPSPELLASYRSMTQHRQRQSIFSKLNSWIKKFSDSMMAGSIGWGVPVSLAAGVIFGVIIAPLWQASLQPGNDLQGHPLGGFRKGKDPTSESPSTQPDKKNCLLKSG